MRTTAAFSVLAAGLLWMGCAPSAPTEEQADAAAAAVVAEAPAERVPEAAELAGVWLLEDLGGRGVMDTAQTTIEFDGEGRVSGSGGCNRFTGSYSYDDGRLDLGPLAGTKMMCPEAVMDQEDRFLRALGAIDRVRVNGSFLLIYFAGRDQPLKFTRGDVVEL
jgi:heat shock protein HslJ